MTPSPRLVYAAALAVVLLAYGPDAHAGGAFGWEDAVGQFADEGISVGRLMAVLGCVAIGIVVALSMGSILTSVFMFTLGGALASNADQVVGTLFGAGGGGGSLSQAISWVPI